MFDRLLGAVCAAAIGCATATAQPTIDGRLAGDEAFYGASLSVQNTNTGYGNATNGDPFLAFNGSEIDQVFAAVVGDRLHVLIAGNFENNYNKLSVFIDSEPGGATVLNGAALPAGVDPFCCPGSPAGVGALQQLSGLRFDNAFAPDHFVSFSNGPEFAQATSTSFDAFSANYADLTAGVAGRKAEVGFQRFAGGFEPGLEQGAPIDAANNACDGDGDASCSPGAHAFAEQRDLLNTVGFRMGIDNRNTQGVNFGSGPATGNPGSVTTGIEFSLPLSTLGSPTDDLRLAAFIGNSTYTNLSNQFAGVGVLRGNFNVPVSAVNLAAVAGDQFVTTPHASLGGDFTYNGLVDAADYTRWRDGLGGDFAAGQYGDWSNAYRGAAPPAAVPEPTAVGLVALAAAAIGTHNPAGRSVKPAKRTSAPPTLRR